MNCRFCKGENLSVFLDLGSAPPSNSFLRAEDLGAPEVFLPLRLLSCRDCLLVQVEQVDVESHLFKADYIYFSSYSRSWVAHARDFVSTAIARLGLTSQSRVLEIASNDGYLLQFMVERGIPCLGIEPTESTAVAARQHGIPTLERFFGLQCAQDVISDWGKADLVIANNVLAHVPDLHDFVGGIAAVLSDDGVASFEFPHLLNMVEQLQFDTAYHEHYSYLSLHFVHALMRRHGLRVWRVDRLATHGGSLRVWVAPMAGARKTDGSADQLLLLEESAGIRDPGFYSNFQGKVDANKYALLEFLMNQRRLGKRVAAYGAAAKGNTMLNYAGVRRDLVEYVADASPHKQGKFLPGSRIPVVSKEHLISQQPDYVLVLPWNLLDEIRGELRGTSEWGCQLVTAIPELKFH